MMNQINNLESKNDSPDLNIPILIEKASSKANDDFQGSLLELRSVLRFNNFIMRYGPYHMLDVFKTSKRLALEAELKSVRADLSAAERKILPPTPSPPPVPPRSAPPTRDNILIGEVEEIKERLDKITTSVKDEIETKHKQLYADLGEKFKQYLSMSDIHGLSTKYFVWSIKN